METYWAIQRRKDGYLLVHTCAWSREGAWEQLNRYVMPATRRTLLKKWSAVKVHVVLAEAK